MTLSKAVVKELLAASCGHVPARFFTFVIFLGRHLIERVPNALVRHFIVMQVETPLVKAETLSEQLGNNIMLKREDLQV